MGQPRRTNTAAPPISAGAPRRAASARRAAQSAPPDPAGLLDRINDGLVVFDREFRYTLVNRQAAAMLGHTVDELVGHGYHELFPEAAGTPFERAYARAMDEQVALVVEDFYAPWDRWFENRIYPLGDGIAILFSEITDRKRAERRLAFQAEVLAAISEAVIGSDADLNVDYWGPGAERLYGWTADEVLGRPVGDVVASDLTRDDRDRALAEVRLAGLWRGEITQHRRDGSPIIVDAHVSRRVGTDGAFAGTIGINRDITERRLVERELERQRHRLAGLREIETAILDSPDPDAMLSTALAVVRQSTGADLAALSRLDPISGENRFVTVDGKSALLSVGTTLIVARQTLDRLKARAPIGPDDLRALVDGSPLVAALVAEGWATSLTAPLHVGDDLVGTLGLLWRSGESVTDEQLAILHELTMIIAVGVRQADFRRVESVNQRDLERHARRLALLHEIDAATLSATTTEDLGAGVLAAVRRTTSAERAVLAVYDSSPEQGQPATSLVVAVDTGVPTDLGVGFRSATDPALDARLQAGEIIHIQDLATAAEANPLFAALAAEGLRAMAILPLTAEGELVGTLTLAWVDASPPEADVARLADDIGESVSLALRQVGLRQRNVTLLHDLEAHVGALERAGRRLESIASVTEVALLDLPIDELLAELLERVRGVLASDTATILLVDPGGVQLVVRSALGIPFDPAKPFSVAVGQGFVGRIAAERRPIVVDDTRTFEFVETTLPRRLRSLVGVPMTVGERVVGVVHVGSRTAREFGDEDVQLLALVAERAAAAIERTRLSDELTRHADELERRVEERTAELSEINAELDAFSYSVSHDLRAPLRAMHGFADALLEDETDRLSETGKGFATRIVGAAGRMEALIDDLLEYGRLSRAHLQLTSVALDRIVAEALHQHETTIRTSRAAIDVARRLGTVRGHPQTLAQVVANLVGNALKYVAEGRVPDIAISAEAVPGGRRLWIEDNGIGIAPEHRERIFRPFERLHGVEAFTGTGIGLAVVRRGLERMEGTCGVESGSSGGSRFWIELPRGGRT